MCRIVHDENNISKRQKKNRNHFFTYHLCICNFAFAEKVKSHKFMNINSYEIEGREQSYLKEIAINLFVVDHIVQARVLGYGYPLFQSSVARIIGFHAFVPRLLPLSSVTGSIRRDKMYYGCSPGKTSLHESCVPMNFLHISGYVSFSRNP